MHDYHVNDLRTLSTPLASLTEDYYSSSLGRYKPNI